MHVEYNADITQALQFSNLSSKDIIKLLALGTKYNVVSIKLFPKKTICSCCQGNLFCTIWFAESALNL